MEVFDMEHFLHQMWSYQLHEGLGLWATMQVQTDALSSER